MAETTRVHDAVAEVSCSGRSLEDSWSRLSASNAGYRAAVADGDIHVVQDGDDWTVAVEGALFKYPTRKEAVEAGRRVAAAAHSKLILVGARVSLQGGPSPGLSEISRCSMC